MFDSGIGGISVLRNMHALLPKESFIYYGDDKNAPYGTKKEAEILALAVRDVEFLLEKGVKAIVIACNTATSAAAAHLREELPLPIIGMEPALKPASLAFPNGRIGVMATPATLRQTKFQLLMEKYGQNAFPIPCAGLMEFVERGEVSGAGLEAFLTNLLSPYRDSGLNAAVIGCTHYVFLKETISKVLASVQLFDGNEGTAKQLARVLEEKKMLNEGGEGSVEMYTSGDEKRLLPLMERLFYEKIV